MEEEKISAETNKVEGLGQTDNNETPVAEGVKEATNQEQPNANDSEVVETQKAEQKPVQSKEENSEFARQRREKELQARIDKEREDARIKTIIDVVGVNPYTQEPLESELDVRIYQEMKQYEKNGGDPVADQAKIIKGIMKSENQAREDSAKKQEKARVDSDNKVKSDIKELQDAYPTLNLENLFANEDFKDYADGKLGVKPLKQIYDGFMKLTTPKVDNNAVIEQERAKAINQASVGSLKGETQKPTGLLTREQISSMSRKDIQANWDLIQKSMASWKE